MVESKEKYKIIVMAILLAGACFLTYYFHAILETGRIFTHLFYFPIILAALWWLSERIAKSHENGPMNEITFEMNQRLTMAIARDITERKWAEAGGKNHEA